MNFFHIGIANPQQLLVLPFYDILKGGHGWGGNQGSGASTNNIHVHGNVLPKTNFPRSDVLGLLARRNIELATGGGDAQLTMALCMYAQCKVESKKQSEIAGTIVASYYQMSNVPSIYQVPELVDNLPPGMPGADPIWVVTIQVVSWQEV